MHTRHFAGGKFEANWNHRVRKGISWKQVTKLIWHKAASPPHMAGSIVFASWRQRAPPSNTWHASLAHPTPHPKRHLDRFGCFRTAHGKEPLYFTMGRPFPLKIAPSQGRSEPPSNAWFLGPTRVHYANGISIGSAVLQGSRSWQIDRETDHSVFYLRIAGRIT